MDINPIIKLDCPDPDVIRTGDTYYMVSTTMHFMPGCEILRSYDLIHWERAAYVYETLDGTPAQRLDSKLHIYGKGMWAASLRFHDGKFYVCFVANDTRKTYLYIADNIRGPWEKRVIEGFYHDCSLLFDDGGRVFIAYGNKNIWLTELKKDLSAPLAGGLHRLIVSDEGNNILGYEGSHIYKIGGKYYLFLIHSKSDRWFRTQACFVSDSLDGEFIGGDVLEDDRGYCGQGVAQGGIVDTPDGDWYAVLFQDSGAVGRIPVLIPVRFEKGFPVFGDNGKIPAEIVTKSTKPDYGYTPLVGSDDFRHSAQLDSKWQFNHEPDESAFSVNTEEGYYEITANKTCAHLTQAVNTITQRMMFPSCAAEVTIDAGGLNEGDYAGICALQGRYAAAAVTRRDNAFCLVLKCRESEDLSMTPLNVDNSHEKECAAIPCGSQITLRLEVDFANMKDEAVFYYKDGMFKQLGNAHRLCFKLDHFMGCRFGLFMYATEKTGGKAGFSDFVYYHNI